MTAGRQASRSTFVCPHCDGDAYLCDASDHGSANGPAIHCREKPHHNEFDRAEFSRWEASHGETTPRLVDQGQVAARWHCAGCHRLRTIAGVYFWQNTEDRGASHYDDCPNCGEREVYGTGWASVSPSARETTPDTPNPRP